MRAALAPTAAGVAPTHVLLTVANSGASRLLVNWACSVQHAFRRSDNNSHRRGSGGGASRDDAARAPLVVLVRTADDALQRQLRHATAVTDSDAPHRRAPFVLRAIRSPRVTAAGYQSMKATNAAFYSIERDKFRALHELLHSSAAAASPPSSLLRILLSDIDVAFVRNPFAHMADDADIELQCDSCDAASYQRARCPFQYNTGLVYLRLTSSNRAALQHLVADVVDASETYARQWRGEQQRAWRQVRVQARRAANRTTASSSPSPSSTSSYHHDQKIFNIVLDRWIARGDALPIAPHESVRHALARRARHRPLTVRYTHWRAFPNGCVAFGSRNRNASAPQALHDARLAAVHANYRSGSEAKIAALRSARAWYIAADASAALSSSSSAAARADLVSQWHRMCASSAGRGDHASSRGGASPK